ncbi:hypothetical protein CsSME_00005344 [Camellia sinensis var. sinensis]
MTMSPAIQTDLIQPQNASLEENYKKKQMDAEPLLSRASCFNNNHHQTRRRAAAKLSSPPPSRQQSFTRNIGHAAAETYLITGLAFKLLGYLGLPVDPATSCPLLLCHATFARLSPSCISLFLFKPSPPECCLWGST